MGGVSIQNFTRRPLLSGRRVFSTIAKEVLPGWEISLVFVGEKRARDLNMQLRRKSYVPNVLSYTAGKKSGEIVICPREAQRQAHEYGMSEKVFILYLFIHGILHIKGWAHGGRMEKCERELLARFAKGEFAAKFNETTHRNGHRHRHLPGKNRRRRGAF